jgi:predicted nucleotidyltransferase component of viral defense system
LPEAYIEKDYFLTLTLANLSKYEYCDHIIFKGGTSLSKIYNVIYRFSEDIDLAILPGENWSNAKITRVMKAAMAVAAGELEDSGEAFKNGSKFRKKRLIYPKVIKADTIGEVTDTLLLECNAYTAPSPVEKKQVRSLIVQWALKQGQQAFIEQFELDDVEISVLSWQRTFCEKILALMAAASRDLLADKVRHFYDLTLLCRNQQINQFLLADNAFFAMMKLTVDNDVSHAGKHIQPWINPQLAENQPFAHFANAWVAVERAWHGPFQMMITQKEHNPSVDEIAATFELIRQRLALYSQSNFHQA